ncbi:MAG: Pre-rRNA-processing protein ipi3 [Candelina mexicana]|nr:MAG: Pre-rRNA-processing protein ipi3 [Candelina mexicana]
MLSELVVTSTLTLDRTAASAGAKDAGIHIHTLHPSPSLKTGFKKSSTPTNCLAVSATHIFAAQAEKAVVHVYSREKGNQEIIIPFAERIRSIALAGDADGAGVLVLGTESDGGGRIILWEICTGRQVSTSQSHLSSVTTLAVDPASNFLLSGSSDSQSIHVWSLPTLLSFSLRSTTDISHSSSREPLRTLTNHRAGVTGLVVGHSQYSTNIAISSSKDNTCVVWNYRTGDLLRTYLLGSAPAVSLALDPADRAFYAGFEDGSIQIFEFFNISELANSLYDPEQSSVPVDSLPLNRWTAQGQNLGTALCLSVNYDGTKLFSGHESGKLISWDIAKGRFSAEIANHGSAVTNLSVLPPTGFPNGTESGLKVHKVIKPNYDTKLSSLGANATGAVPAKYTLTAQFMSTLPAQRVSAAEPLVFVNNEFDAAFTHPSFPASILEEGIAELATWNRNAKTLNGTNGEINGSGEVNGEEERLRKENQELWDLVGEQRRVQKRTWEKLIEWGEERAADRKRTREFEKRKERKQDGAAAPADDDNDVELGDEEDGGDEDMSNDELAGV